MPGVGGIATSSLLYFAASDDGANGAQPWVTDGTTAGTRVLKPESAARSHWAAAGGKVFFGGEVTDGTTAGTSTFRTFDVGESLEVLEPVGNQVFFLTTVMNYGVRLSRSDGTVGGTAVVKGFDRVASQLASWDLVDVNGVAYFVGPTPGEGRELWKSDGTPGGTVLVKDVRPGPSSSLPEHMVVVGDKVVFAADDGEHGEELWVTDGTASGTTLLADIGPGSANGIDSIYGAPFSSKQLGKVFFVANDGARGAELWVTDGTPAGTSLLMDLVPGAAAGSVNVLAAAELGGAVYFFAKQGTSRGLFKTDGTAAGTVHVATLPAGTNEGQRSVIFDGRMYFSTFTSASGKGSLFQTDGTAAGTHAVPGLPDNVHDRELYANARALLFFGSEPSTGFEPWVIEASKSLPSPPGTGSPESSPPPAGNEPSVGGAGAAGSSGAELPGDDGASAEGVTQQGCATAGRGAPAAATLAMLATLALASLRRRRVTD